MEAGRKVLKRQRLWEKQILTVPFHTIVSGGLERVAEGKRLLDVSLAADQVEQADLLLTFQSEHTVRVPLVAEHEAESAISVVEKSRTLNLGGSLMLLQVHHHK